MTLQPESFDLLTGIVQWVITLGTFGLVFFLVATATSLAGHGRKGPGRVVRGTIRGLIDFLTPSPRRVLAIASLTWKESIRRKALLVFVVFAIVFMFASWFMADTTVRADHQVRNYVAFVFIAINLLVLPVVLLLSCWGLPEDIRLRSLHTVVTKPVRRSEVVLGRMVGFSAVGTLVLGIMGIVGYVWIQRQVADDVDLICRVPVCGELSFLDRSGAPAEKGVNVGDIVETRSFVEGGTKAVGIWKFPLTEEADSLKLESRFEAFRTWKGDMKQTLRVRYILVNPEKSLRVPLPPFNVREFANNEFDVARQVTWTDEASLEKRTADIFNDLAQPSDQASLGVLEVHVQCLDRSQFLGASRGDFFVRLPNRSFATGYFKAIVGVWLKMLVVVMIGVTASCFVKWPVATLLCFTVIVIGQLARGFLDKILAGEQLGGGPFESIFRLLTHMNDTSPLPEGTLTVIIQEADRSLTGGLWIVKYMIPDLTTFSMSEWVAKGFDVPWDGVMLPSLAVTVAYAIPCLLLGYFSLSLRELESK